MKVILLQNVPKVGKKYDVKEVASGFARNSLIPRKLAEEATPSAVSRVKVLKEREEKDVAVQRELLAKNMEQIVDAVVVIKAKANDKGHLFAGIHKEELVPAIKDQTRLDIPAEFIELEHPIKEVGEHGVTIKAGDKKAELKVVVEAK